MPQGRPELSKEVRGPVTDDTARSCNDYTGVGNLEAMEAATRYRAFLGSLLKGVPAPGSAHELVALDYGAGVGTYAREARAIGYKVQCVEPDSKLQRLLEDNGFDCFRSSHEVATGSCDLVYSYNVLEHIEDDRGALQELYRVMRPGGALLLYVPAFMVLFGPMDELVGHLRRYRRRDLEALVRGAGFQVQASRYADSLGFLVALAYRFSGRRSGHLDTRSVGLYDRYVFPISRAMDRLVSPLFGKNVVVVAMRAHQ